MTQRVKMVQRTLDDTCPRRRARRTRTLELRSKVPALARDTNVPNKRVCPLCYQTTNAHQIHVVLVETLPSLNTQESRVEMTPCNAIVRLSTRGRLRAQTLRVLWGLSRLSS